MFPAATRRSSIDRRVSFDDAEKRSFLVLERALPTNTHNTTQKQPRRHPPRRSGILLLRFTNRPILRPAAISRRAICTSIKIASGCVAWVALAVVYNVGGALQDVLVRLVFKISLL